jgi:hypothetical protein
MAIKFCWWKSVKLRSGRLVSSWSWLGLAWHASCPPVLAKGDNWRKGYILSSIPEVRKTMSISVYLSNLHPLQEFG